MIDQLHITTLT